MLNPQTAMFSHSPVMFDYVGADATKANRDDDDDDDDDYYYQRHDYNLGGGCGDGVGVHRTVKRKKETPAPASFPGQVLDTSACLHHRLPCGWPKLLRQRELLELCCCFSSGSPRVLFDDGFCIASNRLRGEPRSIILRGLRGAEHNVGFSRT